MHLEEMGLEYHLPKQMWIDDTPLVTLWTHSQCAQVYRSTIFTWMLCCFLLGSWEIPHHDHSFIFRLTEGLWVREVFSLCNHFAVKWKKRRCALFIRPVCPCPTFCVSSGAVLQPDPECCESLFIKSIPAPWPRSSHADCCLLRPLFTFFIHMYTHMCTHADLLWDAQAKDIIAWLWIEFDVATEGLCCCRTSGFDLDAADKDSMTWQWAPLSLFRLFRLSLR